MIAGLGIWVISDLNGRRRRGKFGGSGSLLGFGQAVHRFRYDLEVYFRLFC